MEICNKTVLLTGASGGIGSAIACSLAKAGARLLLCGRERDTLTSLAARLTDADGHALPPSRQPVVIPADITCSVDRQRIVDICAIEGLDILVNSAGSQLFGLFEEQSQEAIAALLTINLVAPIELTRQLLPLINMRPEAAVVMVGSTLGAIGHPAYTCYCASKFGMRGFVEALGRELADSPVRVHYLAPRATRTALNNDRAMAMNSALGNNVDEPERVAEKLLDVLHRGGGGSRFMGWPEKLLVRINQLLPRLVDRALFSQLDTIKHYARNL